MDWIDEIKEAMETIKTACNKNERWTACCKCPFDQYCTVLENEGMDYPGKWNFEDGTTVDFDDADLNGGLNYYII